MGDERAEGEGRMREKRGGMREKGEKNRKRGREEKDETFARAAPRKEGDKGREGEVREWEGGEVFPLSAPHTYIMH